MRSSRDFHTSLTIGCRLLAAALLAAGVGACSAGGAPSVAPYSGISNAQTAGGARNVRFDAAHCPASVVYIVANYNSTVAVYDRANLQAGPCGIITGLQIPQGLFADSHGNLWVADAGANAVYEFARGASSPKLTLNDPNGMPNDVTVDELSGTIYVTEYKNTVSPSTLVEVYAKGSTAPTGSLSDPDARNGGYGAVDNKGNLYVTFMTQENKAQVDRWMGGSGAPQNLGLKIVSDGGIATTATGALAVCDPFYYRCGLFKSGSTRMTNIFGHMGTGRNGIGPDKPPWLMPQAVALDRGEHVAFVAAESLTTWRYPGPDHRPNHLPMVEIKVRGLAGEGIAVSPAARPGAPY